MENLKTFKISSEFINTLHIPIEANMKYLNESDIEITRQKIEKHLSSQKWFSKGVKVTVEERKQTSQFNSDLFEEQNIKILCYIGFSFPRYFKGQEVYYGCWELYEFGDWDKNQNIYYKKNGEYLRTEKL